MGVLKKNVKSLIIEHTFFHSNRPVIKLYFIIPLLWMTCQILLTTHIICFVYVLKPCYSVHTTLKFSYIPDEHLITILCLQVYFVWYKNCFIIFLFINIFSSFFYFSCSNFLCAYDRLACKQNIAIAIFLKNPVW